MKKVLILGGTRYLGKAIVNQLSLNSKFVIASLSRSNEKNTINHFVCDRKKPEDLNKVFKEFSPNIIIDMVNFDREDSKNIAALYRNNSLPYLSHYIMISTFLVYNYFDYTAFSEKNINENYNNEKVDEYTNRKIESELALYSSSIMDITTILRLPFVFSADDYTKRFQAVCKISLRASLSDSYNTHCYSLIQKNDAANAIISLLDLTPIGIADISNIGCVTDKKIIEILSEKVSIEKNSNNSLNEKFPYIVKQDICLASKKLIIKVPISLAIKKEGEKYFSSFNDSEIVKNNEGYI